VRTASWREKIMDKILNVNDMDEPPRALSEIELDEVSGGVTNVRQQAHVINSGGVLIIQIAVADTGIFIPL
jgi:hypothetical protein